MTDPSIQRNRLLAARAAFDAIRRKHQSGPLKHRADILIQNIDQAVKDACPSLMRQFGFNVLDYERTVKHGPPQIVGTYDPENPPVFVRAEG